MYKIPKFYPKKMARRRRKLRSLVCIAPQPKSLNSSQWPLYVVLSLSLVILGIYYSNINTTSFLTSYRNHYHQIVDGEMDYCRPITDTGELFAKVSKRVLNQQAALAKIENQFEDDTRFTAIAIIGSSGVGKSLFVQALKEHFPWQENTQGYSWSGFYPANEKKETVLMFLNYLSECGRNLIIIDNLRLEDVEFVQEYNGYALKHVEQATANLIVLYVFNVVTYTEEQQEQYHDNMKALEHLKNVTIVQFREFDLNDVKDCIRHEAKSLNLTLDYDNFEEVVKLIDVKPSGCKNVYSKVRMYGKMKDWY